MKEIKPNNIIIKKSNNVVYIIDAVNKSIEDATIVRLGDGLRETLDFVSLEMLFDITIEKSLVKDIQQINKTLKGKNKIIKYDKELNHVVLVDCKTIQKEILNSLDKEMARFMNNSKRNNLIIQDQVVNFVEKEKENCQMFLDQRRVQDKVAAELRLKIAEDLVLQKNETEAPQDAIVGRDLSFLIIEPDSKLTMADVIIDVNTLRSIEQEFSKMEFSDFFDNEWGLGEISPVNKSCNLNFYGPSGTGKTLTVKAFANKLNKRIIQVDFSQLISKYIGDTGKNIQKYFQKAKELDAILFFDEADSLMTKRVDSGSDQNSSTINQNQNIFMQEVDRYSGVIILATNYFQNYDEAVSRRFTSIKFNLPDDSLRLKLIEKNLSKKINLGSDFDISDFVKKTNGMSGADIKNICVNALINKATGIRLANLNKSKDDVLFILRNTTINMDSFDSEIKKIIETKKNNSGKIDKVKIGLNAA